MLRITKRNLVLVFALAVLLAGFLVPQAEGLTTEGHRALTVFAVCLILWVTQALPLSVTGLLVFILLPLLQVRTPQETFSLFGNNAVFFILGALILASGMMKTGLSTRFAFYFLSKFGRSPATLALGILVSSAFLTFWMPEHAVAALLFPIVLEICFALRLRPLQSQYGKLLFLSLAWGAVIGGVATLLGGARNPLAIQILQEMYGTSIGFFGWIIAVFPIVVVILLAAFVILLLFFRPDIKDISPAVDVLREEVAMRGPLSGGEKRMIAVMLITTVLWVTQSKLLGLANIALMGAVSLFILKVIRWEDAEEYVNWGIILMYGGAVAIASSLADTGAAQWFADTVFTNPELSPFTIVALIALASVLLTEGISNVAAVAILLPIGFSLGNTYGVNPIAIVYATAVTAGLAFCLPMGTPPNAICISSGYYKVADSVKPGIILNIISWLAFLLLARVYWPLIGIDLLATSVP
ncbi:MAG: DASS family sodium-coupled anion symporter [Candidatus Eisenbacteria sp.]|nr:DASS family sodium-coupled anion symporter [Candidatus Eisenbacteria bacterium]